jgi:hypothetical protein
MKDEPLQQAHREQAPHRVLLATIFVWGSPHAQPRIVDNIIGIKSLKSVVREAWAPIDYGKQGA